MSSPATFAPETRPLAAALSMLAAMGIIGVIDAYIAQLAPHMGLWQFHAMRAGMALPLVVGLSLLGLGRLRPRRWWAVAARSGFIALAMLFYFSALAVLPIAQALAGLFTSPLFILLFSVLLPGMRIGPWRIFAVGLGFAGIVLVLQPSPGNAGWSSLFPVAGGMFYAMGALSTRAWCADESPVALLAGVMGMLGLVGLVGLMVLAAWPVPPGTEGFVTRGWSWEVGPALPLVVLQAVGSVAGVFLIIRAYQLGEPSYVSVFEYAVMVFGPVYALWAFGQTIGPWQVAGIGLIVLAGAVIALRSRDDTLSA